MKFGKFRQGQIGRRLDLTKDQKMQIGIYLAQAHQRFEGY